MKENKLICLLFCALMAAIMYCFAFHEEREKNKILEEKIIKLEKIKR